MKKTLLLLVAVATALLLNPALAACEDQSKSVKNPLGMEFVLIPAGSFMMGSAPDAPGHQSGEFLHKVSITKPFYMQTTEVTLGQWWEVMGKGWIFRRQGKPDYPVTEVSWFQVERFIRKLNRKGMGTYRLPTEAEWEYAARAGSTTLYPWGDGINCHQAMYANNTNGRSDCVEYYSHRGLPNDSPAPVKSFPPNAWGLYDTSGNVWEWCADWYGPYPKKAVSDPQGPAEGTWRVRRGGSWFAGPRVLETDNRNFAHPASKYATLGFRLVREVK